MTPSPSPALSLPSPLTVGQVERALNLGSTDRVAKLWPLIRAALAEIGDDSIPAQLAVAANVSTECRFALVAEKGSPDYFAKYEPNTSTGRILGNTEKGDGWLFKGRGPVQLTGRWNYRHIGKLIDVDLEATPERMLDPKTAARATVAYLRDKKAFAAAKEGDWARVRRAVQPGPDPAGMERFNRALAALQKEVEP